MSLLSSSGFMGSEYQYWLACELLNDSYVSKSSVPTPTSVALPPQPPNNGRTIYDVQQGTGNDAQAIQTAINNAVNGGTSHPVVHIPMGTYYISTTISVPASFDMSIIGDGGHIYGSFLNWNGSGDGPLLQLNGPSRVTLRDLCLNSHAVDSLYVTNANQVNGQVYSEFFNPSGNAGYPDTNNTGVLVNGVEDAMVTFVAMNMSNNNCCLNVVGGTKGASGQQPAGMNAWVLGATSDPTDYFATVSNGGQAVVRGIYCELGSNNATQDFATCQAVDLTDKGNLTLAGCRLVYADNSATPNYEVNGFDGWFNLISGVDVTPSSEYSNGPGDHWYQLQGNGSNMNVLVLSQDSSNHTAVSSIWNDSTSPAGNCSYCQGGGGTETNKAVNAWPSSGFVLNGLTNMRSVHVTTPTAAPSGCANVRFYHTLVSSDQGYNACTLESGGVSQVLPPSFTPGAGSYSSAQNVTMGCGTSGATIRYTTNGTTPSETVGTVYSSPVNIAASCTLQAIAYESGMSDSSITNGVYTISVNQCATPTFNPAAGSYGSAQNVTIGTTTSGATIRYTTSGTTPTETVGTVYSSAVNIAASCTLEAIAYESGYTDSTVASGTYTISPAA